MRRFKGQLPARKAGSVVYLAHFIKCISRSSKYCHDYTDIYEGLTFDDVLLVPARSDVLPYGLTRALNSLATFAFRFRFVQPQWTL